MAAARRISELSRAIAIRFQGAKKAEDGGGKRRNVRGERGGLREGEGRNSFRHQYSQKKVALSQRPIPRGAGGGGGGGEGGGGGVESRGSRLK